MAVIDASVYIALINTHEAASASSWAWFRQAIRDREPVVAPVIMPAEVAAALSRGLDDPKLAHRAAGRLQRSRIIKLVPVSASLAKQAAIIAADCRIRGCDAVYVALARQRGEDLITLDHQQLERGAAVVTTRRPA